MTPPAEAKLKKNVVFFTGRMPVPRLRLDNDLWLN